MKERYELAKRFEVKLIGGVFDFANQYLKKEYIDKNEDLSMMSYFRDHGFCYIPAEKSEIGKLVTFFGRSENAG